MSEMTSMHPRVAEEMQASYLALSARGELLSVEKLESWYTVFRQRFGPEILRTLNGQALLDLLKGGGRDGLVYWLEFKDDDEFPARFGSIAGGSALKYGVYRRRETGAWTTGSPLAQREISTEEALAIAVSHRDQLIAAAELLERHPPDSDDEGYEQLQKRIAGAAPDVQDSSWGHKYLSLVFPAKLDDFHAESYQRHNLIKTVQTPAAVEGRYSNAGRFVRMARELSWPLNHLTTVLNRRNGPPHRYWRVGTRSGRTNESHWEMMRQRSVIAIGWHELGDLSGVMPQENFKEQLKRDLAEKYPNEPSAIGRAAQQIAHFCKTMQMRDYVIASDGQETLGVGKVVGDYEFDATARFPHMRSVEWLSLDKWRMPIPEGLRTTVHEIRKHVQNLVEIERHVVETAAAPPVPPVPPETKPKITDTTATHAEWTGGGLIARLQDVLARKSQLILYGPPGTGKTHWAERAAHELAALWNFGEALAALSKSQRDRIVAHDEQSFVRICSFHPGYGYEDFIEGYRPSLAGNSVYFALQDGIFKKLSATARDNPDRRYYLIIDEINRGDIPRIFGELLTLLEKPKRGTSVTLPLSGTSFSVPSNLFVIGTMNTADRSIALLDAALRRRFGFVELMPDADVLGKAVIAGIALGPWLTALNELVVAHVGRDGRNLQIGHSYFLSGGRPIQELRQFSRVLQEDVLPLLEEYCYDDWSRLEQILKKGLVDTDRGRFRSELFEPGREEDLVQAVLAIAPDVSASFIAVEAEAQQAPDGDAEEQEETDETTEA
jgi:5-methylcytosine-specific restriction protein B